MSLAGLGPVPVAEGEAWDVVRERGWREEGCTLGRGSGALGCGSDAAWERAEGEGSGCSRAGPGREGSWARRGEGGPANRLWVGFGFLLSYFYFFSFSISNQTNLGEIKFKFEFTTSTQTTKSMHQHECINKVNPMINFNYLWNKN